MQTDISFTSTSGVTIRGILSDTLDNSSEKKAPLVIICHGFHSNKDRLTYTRPEKLLNDKGIATFRFDFFGHGESGGEFSDITLTEAIDDLIQAHHTMKGLGYTTISYFGASFGGCVVLNAATIVGGDIECVVAMCPVSDYPTKLRQELGEDKIQQRKESGLRIYVDRDGVGYDNKYKFYEDGFHHIIDKDKATKIVSPLMIIHGDEDEDVPIEQSNQTASLIPHCDYRMIQGAGHAFEKEGQRDLIYGYMIEFFMKHLF